VLVLHGAADAIESATPYFAWREVFAQLLGVAALDDREARRAEVERRLDPELVNQAPLLEAVLTLGIPDTPETAELSGQMRANATRDLLLTILERAAATELTCVVLEDAHWLDAASWSLALGVSRRIVSLQLTLTARPIADPQPRELALLQSGPQCTTLVLEPLAADDTLALVCRRLGASALRPEIETLIRTRAGGHPFFAEELASALRDSGVIEVLDGVCRLARGVDPDALAFPDTLQGLVTARIDLLAPQEQLALKVASVIGTAFAVRVLRDVHPVREDLGRLESSIEELRRADLTVLETPAPDLAYAFKHIITREVAYNLMLFMQRRQLHHAVAEWHERVHGDERPELFAVLAHHWSHAGVVEKAIAYHVKSATRTFSMGLSRAAADQGLDAARMLGLTLPRDPAEIGLLLKAELERIHERLGGRAPGALLDLPPLTDANVGALIGLLLRIEPFVHVSGQMELFALIATRCMSLTLEHGNGPAAPLVYAMFSIVYRVMTQDTATAVAFSELSLDLDAKQGRRLFSPVAFIHHWFNYHWVHPVEERLDMVAQAADAGFATNDIMYGCFNNSAYVIYVALAGRPLPEVIEVARRHYARNGRRVLNAAFHCIHELQMAKALAGDTLHQLSLTDAEYDEERDIASVCGTDQYTEAGWYYASKMRLHYLFDDAAGALRYAGETVPLLPSILGQPVESEFAVYRTLALLARARELPADASGEREATMRQARSGVEQIRLWASVGERSFAHRLLLVEGELASVEGRAEDADRALVAAAEKARSLGQTHYEGLAHERRAALRRAAGDDAARESVDAARDAYSRWGARALIEELDRRYG
jgi:predicted ATPase